MIRALGWNGRSILLYVGEQIIHLQVDAIGPTEADDVALVARSNFYVGGTVDDVVLFTDGAVSEEVLPDGL